MGLLLALFLSRGAYSTAVRPELRDDVIFYKETDYFTIKTVDVSRSDSVNRLRAMVLDNLVHSLSDLDDPLHLEYRYEQLCAEFFAWRFPDRQASLKSLMIGGGGYTFPRYMEAVYPQAGIDVVELDPEVMKTAFEYMGLPRDTRIHSFTVDGRWFVRNSTAVYDVIFIDVFNDLSMPPHLTTYEFALEVRRILKPDGFLLVNIVDHFREGLFLPAYLRTLMAVFGDDHVHLLTISPLFDTVKTATCIVLVSKGPHGIEGFESFINRKGKEKATAFLVPADVMRKYITDRSSVMLTDEFMPVDNLIAPVFQERFGDKRY